MPGRVARNVDRSERIGKSLVASPFGDSAKKLLALFVTRTFSGEPLSKTSSPCTMVNVCRQREVLSGHAKQSVRAGARWYVIKLDVTLEFGNLL